MEARDGCQLSCSNKVPIVWISRQKSWNKKISAAVRPSLLRGSNKYFNERDFVPIKDFSLHAINFWGHYLFFPQSSYIKGHFFKNQQQIIVLLESRAGSAHGCCERRGVWQLELSDKISESREYFKFSLSTLFPHRLRPPSPARSLYCSGELSAEISQKLNLIWHIHNPNLQDDKRRTNTSHTSL